MVSEFLCAAGGRLSTYDRASHARQYATEIFKYGSGASDEGWWYSKKMLNACKADDALVANRMNLGSGGKQPKMHHTTLPNGQVQSMTFNSEDRIWGSDIPIPDSFVGLPKGMKRVLEERNLWRDGLKKQCGVVKAKDNLNDAGQQSYSAEAHTSELDRAKKGRIAVLYEFLKINQIFSMRSRFWRSKSPHAGMNASSILNSTASSTILNTSGRQ
jgi:hypothetical protein